MNLREHFIKFTKRYFQYLEEEFSFVLTSMDAPFVIYDSAHLRVYIYFDAERRGELDATIERLSDVGKKKPSVGISELISLQNPRTEIYESPYPCNAEELRVELQRLAYLLKKYGTELLVGGLTEMEKIEELRNEREKAILASMRKASDAG